MSNPFDNVNITSFYDAYRQGKQDKRTDRFNAMQDEYLVNQKKTADEQLRFSTAYQIVDALERTDEPNRAKIYQQAIPTLQRLFPEYQFPPQYSPEWSGELSALKTYFGSAIPTQYKSAGDTLYRIQGSDVKPVGIGAGDKGKIVARKDFTDGVEVERSLYQFRNDRGDLQEGDDIFNAEYPRGVNAEQYYRWKDAQKPPEEKPPTVNKVPSAPIQSAVSGSSDANRAGETNVGYAIPDEPKQQPTPMAEGAPPVAQTASPQAMPAQSMNAMIPEADQGMNRFATLQPFGSEPMNRLAGSQGIEGMEQAYVGRNGQPAPAMPPKPVGGVVRARPPSQQAPRSNFRPANATELAKYNIDPLLQSAQVDTTTGEIKTVDRKTKEQALLEQLETQKEQLAVLEAEASQGKSRAELEKARIEAMKARDELEKLRTTKRMALKGILDMEDAVMRMKDNNFVDTGRFEQAFAYFPNPWSSDLRRINDVTKQAGDAVKSYIRIAGQGDLNKSEQEWAVGVYPDIGIDYESNIARVQALKQRFMQYNNVDYIVRSQEDMAKVPVGKVYFNAVTGKKMVKVGE